MGAREALPVPRLVLVCNAAAGDDFIALDAARGEFLLVTFSAVDLLFPWNETLRSYRCLTDDAAEALLVPLPRLVFHLFGTCPEDFVAAIAP